MSNQNEIRSPYETDESEGRNFGPIVGGLIIMAILISAGIFVLGDKTSSSQTPTATSTNTIIITQEEPPAENPLPLPSQSSSTPLSDSDELKTLEGELTGTDLPSLDTQINQY